MKWCSNPQEIAVEALMRRRLIKAIVRKARCRHWFDIWKLFDEIALNDPSETVRGAAAIGMSMIVVQNGPPSSILGNSPPPIWNEDD